MPIYEFKNKLSGEIREELCSIAKMQEIIERGEDELVPCTPAFVSGIAGVTHKIDSGFGDVLNRVATANPTTPLAEKYGDKGIRATQVRNVVKNVKERLSKN